MCANINRNIHTNILGPVYKMVHHKKERKIIKRDNISKQNTMYSIYICIYNIAPRTINALYLQGL